MWRRIINGLKGFNGLRGWKDGDAVVNKTDLDRWLTESYAVKHWLLLLLLLIPGVHAAGQGIIVVDDAIDERNFMPYELTYFVDTTNSLSFEVVSSTLFSEKFKNNSAYQNKVFKINASYWIRLPIRHTTRTQKVWLLEFYDQTIDYLDAYVPQADGSYKKVSMGDKLTFGERTLLHKNFEIPLRMNSDTLMVYYFSVQSHGFADIRIAFRSVNRFVYYALNEYFLFGTFYGMVLIISLYNFLVFLAIKEIKNIYYILYILSVAAYAMSYDGIGFQYLWPQRPEWNDYATGMTLYSVILWSLIFTRRFLRTKAHVPGLDRALKWIIVLRSAFFVVEIFYLPELLTYRNIEIISLSLIFYSAIRVWNRGYRPARFFVMAYGILFAGFLSVHSYISTCYPLRRLCITAFTSALCWKCFSSLSPWRTAFAFSRLCATALKSASFISTRSTCD
jgi:hypothetical protein